MVVVVDRSGNPLEITWEEVQAQYGLWMKAAEPPKGAAVWRLTGLIHDTTPETNFRIYCKDANGAPLAGIVAFLGISPGDHAQGLPDDAAPLLAGTVPGQPIDQSTGQPYPNVALKHETYKTNADGYYQHSLGDGSNTVPGRPIYQWSWVMPGDNKDYSDWIYGVGGMVEENGVEHQMFWPVFQKVTESDDDDDDDDDNGEVEPGTINIKGTVEVDLTITIG